MTIGLGILLLPASYHFIVEGGENTRSFHELVTRILEWALFPFALGLGVAVFAVGEKVMTTIAGAVAGIFITAFAFSGWYILAIYKRKNTPPLPKEEPSKITEKIKEALIEARMVLPGAQALLGFQVANTFTNSFEQLPRVAQWLHLASLLSVAVATILLIAPAAYHRIAEHGEDSEEFYNLAGRFLLTALVFLGLGISFDLWVIFRKISDSILLSNVLSAMTLLFFYGVWFGYSALKRNGKAAQKIRLAG